MTNQHQSIRRSTWSLALGIVAAGWLGGCSKPPVEVEIIRPVRAVRVVATERQSPWYPGRARATQHVNIAFEVPGRLIERHVNVGDRVEAGDVMARLDPRDFQNDLDAADAQLDQAKAYLDRIEQAARSGAVSQQEVTDARAARDVAVATVNIKKKALDDTNIVAPFAGTIAATYVENFQNIRAKEDVVRLLDASRIEMIVHLPEQVMTRLGYVTDLQCRFDAYPGQTITAEVKEIGTEASEATRTYPITLIMDQPDDFHVLPGMTGEAAASGAAPGEGVGIEVPTSAVFQEDDRSFVWVIDEARSTVSRRPVTAGMLTAGGMRVDGVEPGQLVATAGVHYLSEGQEVTVLLPDRDTNAEAPR